MNARLFVALIVTFLGPQFLHAAEHTKDTLAKVKETLAEKKAVLLDVREQKEWDGGHLREAQLLPLSELKKMAADATAKQRLEKRLAKDRIIYCHCASGRRVLNAADLLKPLGYDVRPLAAGFDDLVGAGFAPQDKPAAKP